MTSPTFSVPRDIVCIYTVTAFGILFGKFEAGLDVHEGLSALGQ